MPFPETVDVRPDPDAVAVATTAAAARGRVVPPRTAADVRRERAARGEPPGDPRARSREIPGADGPVALRVIDPDGPARALRVTAHASGWCLGTAVLDDAVGGRLASTAGVTSVSVDYRLAPEHPFPAGLRDLTAALTWATEREAPVVAAGASAGSHLMLLAVLALRRERPDLADRIVALELRYGCYDLGGTPSLRAANDDAPIVTRAGTAALLDHAFPGIDDDGRRDPSSSPLYADLRGLPPTLLSVGGSDGLRDDSMFLAARLAAAGVPTTLEVWAGCPHVFDTLSPALADDYAARAGAWLEASGM